MAQPGTFQKGDDPRRNVKGRPPRKSMTTHLDEAMTDAARKKIAMMIREKAKKGDMAAATFVYDRLDGRAKQSVEHTGADGGEITIRMVTNDNSDS